MLKGIKKLPEEKENKEERVNTKRNPNLSLKGVHTLNMVCAPFFYATGFFLSDFMIR